MYHPPCIFLYILRRVLGGKNPHQYVNLSSIVFGFCDIISILRNFQDFKDKCSKWMWKINYFAKDVDRNKKLPSIVKSKVVIHHEVWNGTNAHLRCNGQIGLTCHRTIWKLGEVGKTIREHLQFVQVSWLNPQQILVLLVIIWVGW